MGKMKNTHKIMAEKLERRRLLGEPVEMEV
jgi:hypothetical protein